MGEREARAAQLEPTVSARQGDDIRVDTRCRCGDGRSRSRPARLRGWRWTASTSSKRSRSGSVLGIPAGVKMHSAVFAMNPSSAGELIVHLAREGVRRLRPAEVMDVDEALLRAGAVSARLHGFSTFRTSVATCRARRLARSEARRAQEEIATPDRQRPRRPHLVDRPGTTTGSLLAQLKLDATLLGVDVVRAGTCVIRDADERALVQHSRSRTRASS